jgi:hypothetical protein
MYKHALAAAAAVAFIHLPSTAAEVVTQWNFNSLPADGATGTGTTAAAIGSGTASLVGGATASFASGDASGGSSDPASGDDSGWNLTTFAAQGTGSGTRGAQFAVSTAGFENLVISFDLRHSNTSARHELLQISLDGISFSDFALFDADAGGDRWYTGRTVDLSAVAGASDNASFAFRVVSAFAPTTGQYAATGVGSSYGTSGTWRMDMVTLSGTAIAPVPEPGAMALLLAGLGVIGTVVRRRA